MNMESGAGRLDRELIGRLRAELDALPVSLPVASPAPYRLRPLKLVPVVALAVGAALVLGTVAAVASSTPYAGQLVLAAEQSLGIPTHRPDTTTLDHPTAKPTAEPGESSGSSSSPETGGPGGERESPEPGQGPATGSPEPNDGPDRSSAGDG